MPSLQDYLNKLPDYNSVQPDFTAAISAALLPLVNLQSMLAGMPQQFDLDYAIGVQLDQVGLWIGVSRYINLPSQEVYFSWDTDGLGWDQGYWEGSDAVSPGQVALDDTTYRNLLYAKAVANQSDGSLTMILESLGYLLANTGASYIVSDNQNMTMTITITGLQDAVITQILQGGYLPIKPAGVGITFNISG